MFNVLRLVFMLLLVAAIPVGAQTDWRQDIRQWLTVEGDVDGADADDILELLTDLAETKLDINSASREDLRRLPLIFRTRLPCLRQDR